MIQFQYVQPPELTIEQQAMINMYMNILNRSCDKVPSDNTNDQTLDYLYEVYILTFKDRNTKNCWISGAKFINYSTVIAEKVIINNADTSAMKPALIFNPHDDEIFKQYYDMNNEL